MPEQVTQYTLENVSELWNKILQRVQSELSEQSFKTWISQIKCRSISVDQIALLVPDAFYGDWVREHYETLIQSAAQEVLGFRPQLQYEIMETSAQQKNIALPPTPTPENRKKKEPSGLNPRYTFDGFVVGPGNRFAHAAALAVSEDLARKYNPLFIYGGVGLGKTHLLQAVAHATLGKNQNAKVVYISSEKFTIELISAIQSRSTPSFRERYRAVDLLLIDDIHFIAGKESTQEEFFHTFNTLYDAHKQIVVTSDRPPKEIPGLEERLVSRFGWGLVADIQAPDFETRVAILKKRLAEQSVFVPDDVLFLIAERIKSNIRELEGALVRVVAYSSLMGVPVSPNLTQNVLKEAFLEEQGKVTVDVIQEKVSGFFGIRVGDLRAKRRNASIVLARQVAMYLARQLTSHSLPELGGCFGGRGHATVLHGINRIKKRLLIDPTFQQSVSELVVLIKG